MEIPADDNKYADLVNNFIRNGEITWIGICQKPREPLTVLRESYIQPFGLINDLHNKVNSEGKRQVTLIQSGHLQAAASFLCRDDIDPSLVRRNIVVKGINLYALTGKRIRIGEAILEITGLCHPCRRMEENLGKGGYNAMRGHGGFTCRVIAEGRIRVGDIVSIAPVD